MRLLKIDEITRPDHSHLDVNDECYYVLEYAARQGARHSSANDLIINLKKPVDRRGRPEYRYKDQAIQRAGDILRSVLNEEFITTSTLVPIPCSKTATHPLHDPRMNQILHRMATGLKSDIRELIIQTADLKSFHDGCRLRPEELAACYEIDANLSQGSVPARVAIFDDILTTGSHFKAASSCIRDVWPEVPLVGIFLARRYFPTPIN